MITPQGIEFNLSPKNKLYNNCTLYPETGKHSLVVIKEAREWLICYHNVVGIQVRWKGKDDTGDLPETIPDFIIIQELRKEIGKLKAYIDELESEHKKNLQEEKVQDRKNILKEELYKVIKKELSVKKDEVFKLRAEISKLVTQIIQLKNATGGSRNSPS